MNNVIIDNRKMKVDGEKSLQLNNGSLVLTYNAMNEVLDAYIVTSFRDNNNRYNGAPTPTYCSLVNLDTGYLAFEERCSRKTTINRVLSHLTAECFDGNHLTSRGYYVEVYPKGDYKTIIQLSEVK